jgi:O-antigen/teichoic acid export membrane protein
MITKITELLNLKNSRNRNLAKNIGFTTLGQFGSLLLSLIILPVSLSLIPVQEYGVWLTISSILTWVGYFDLGLGTGLKNKLGEALANLDFIKARKLITTAYLTLAVTMLVIVIIFSIIVNNTNIIIEMFGSNLSESFRGQLIQTLNVVVYLFIVRFVLQLINPILEANQLIYLTRLGNFMSQLLILIFLSLSNVLYEPCILNLGIIFSTSPLICYLIVTFFYFKKNPNVRPGYHYFDKTKIKELYNIGLKFFLIQLNMLILFQSSNFLILNFIGPKEVVQYNVAYNLFSMINVVFSTITAPYWSAYTSAWYQNDIIWIKNAQRKLIFIWLILVSFAFIGLIFSDWIFKFWVGSRVIIPFSLSVSVFIFISLFSFGMIFNLFVNSTGKILLQTISMTCLTLIYVPLVYFLIEKAHLGLNAIPISLSIVALYTVIISPIQSHRLLNKTARGILNK